MFSFLVFWSLFLFASFSSLTAWSRRERWIRWAIIAFLCISLPIMYFSITELLSRPKEISHEVLLSDTPKAQVLGYHIDEDAALYLFLYSREWGQPRYFQITWSDATKKLADELRKKGPKARKQNKPLFMTFPFKKSLEMEKFSNLPPQPADSPKPPYTNRAQEFNI